MLHPDGKNIPVVIEDIEKTVIFGSINEVKQDITIDGGYLDLGIYDTMEDLWVNFLGAFVFSVLGWLYIKTRGKGSLIKHFIIRKKKKTS